MTDRVRQVMREVPRRRFLPKAERAWAGLDRALDIGYGATCSQPSTVVRLLELLDARPGHRVLDVGSGSGWTTAMLARLVSPDGWVVGVEIVPELVERSRAALEAHDVQGARVEQAVKGVLGRPADGPYDRILVSAEAHDVPQPLLDQLADGGRMVVPVRGRLVTAELHDGKVSTESEGWYSFVPLQGS
ncbi:protein-L-isoaspartate O-methyltransferase family protein [Ornithinimicrobium sediminis]|uniref:protein-L-isoaspartate O-methyltransferase family protein n=1 Tax=Ornithinimicrobium sediminis TaxID=2904603 RepID=UPI001E49AF66|nr:methyltransferase domain-containing protein [Ornithinimicrobium sediminis]MCE0487457.1 protein-L-isoaspartate O-methyltransferase [Ornithinimicrobium sediminis]